MKHEYFKKDTVIFYEGTTNFKLNKNVKAQWEIDFM